MSRIAGTLDALLSKGRKALIPYVTVGDPFADATPEIMRGLVQGGADIIELGVPFSDPMAAGPVIQKAGERALARGIGMPQVLEAVRQFRSSSGASSTSSPNASRTATATPAHSSPSAPARPRTPPVGAPAMSRSTMPSA